MNITDKIYDNCFECENCINLCPSKAIEMKRNAIGEGYPIVDRLKCVECERCLKVCPRIKNVEKNLCVDAFAAFATANDVDKSTSGGIFYALAVEVLKRKGIVIGAAYDKNTWTAHHIAVDKIEDLQKIQGSKYVKSALGDVFYIVQRALKNNKWVLFSGTPCQVEALDLFLPTGIIREHLITVDIVCHGTPTGKMFQDMLSEIRNKRGVDITEFNFRDKKYGNKLIGSYIAGKKYPLYSSESSYYSMFLNGLIYNKICYSCPFATNKRVGDITIGDFWGIQEEIPKFYESYVLNRDASVSAVLVNTEAGRQIFDSIKDSIIFTKTDLEKITKHNPQLNRPTMCNMEERNRIMKTYVENGYPEVEKIFRKNVSLRTYEMRILSWIPIKWKKKVKQLIKKQ